MGTKRRRAATEGDGDAQDRAPHPHDGPQTPAGKPPASCSRKTVRRSLTTGRVSQSPATAAAQKIRPEVAMLNFSLVEAARDLGLTLRAATLADSENLSQAHTRFEIEMAGWGAGGDGAINIGHDITDGIRR